MPWRAWLGGQALALSTLVAVMSGMTGTRHRFRHFVCQSRLTHGFCPARLTDCLHSHGNPGRSVQTGPQVARQPIARSARGC